MTRSKTTATAPSSSSSSRTAAARKRARSRHDDEDDEDDIDPNDDAPVFQSAQVSRSLSSSSSSNSPLRTGSLLSVTLYNFMTYDYCRADFGVNLNLIVGPNGAGKSSIISAICLGLGGSPSSLGRSNTHAKETFIKRRCDRAVIVTELYHGGYQPDHHLLIKFVMNRESAPEWYQRERTEEQRQRDLTRSDTNMNTSVMNADADTRLYERSNRGEILARMKELHITVDNLCVLLAQDKVGSFALMNQKELLLNTLQSSNQLLYEEYNLLINSIQQERDTLIITNKLIEDLKKLNDRKLIMEPEVQQQRERNDYKEKLNLYKKLSVWWEYREGLLEVDRLNNLRQESENKLQEQINKQSPLIEENENKKKNLNNIEKLKINTEKNLMIIHTHYKNLIHQIKIQSDLYDDKLNEINSIEEQRYEREKQIKILQTSINQQTKLITIIQQENEMNNNNNNSSTEQKLLQLNEQLILSRRQQHESNNNITRLTTDIRHLSEEKNTIEKNIKELNNQSSRRILKALNNSDQNNRRDYNIVNNLRSTFYQDVYGPLIAEIIVKDDLTAKYVETLLSFPQKWSYITASEDDWKALSSQINANLIHQEMDATSIPTTDQRLLHALQPYGVIGFLIDFIECPLLVKATLCKIFNFHQIAITHRECTDDELIHILARTRDDTVTRTRMLCTPSSSHSVNFSHLPPYTPRASLNPINANTRFITVGGGQHDEQALNELQQSLEQIEVSIQNKQDLMNKTRQTQQTLQQQVTSIQQQITEINQSQHRLKQEENKLLHFQQKLSQLNLQKNDEKLKDKYNKQLISIHQARLNRINEMSNDEQNLLQAHREVTNHTLTEQCERMAFQSIQDQLRELSRSLQEYRAAVDDATRAHRRQLDQIHGLHTKATSECDEKYFDDLYANPETNAELPQGKSGCDSAIEDIQFSLKHLRDDSDVIATFNALEGQIMALEPSVQQQQDEYSEMVQRNLAAREQWERAVKLIIAQMNTSFQTFFQSIGCSGNISLTDTSDIDAYGIIISVSFRRGEPARTLSGDSHSGGEKSMSTMCYLLSLQSVTDSPFRLVDEINQGVDPLFERRLFTIIVNAINHGNQQHGGNANNNRQASNQYVIVTPKLLPNLAYPIDVTVLAIHSGSYMLQQNQFNPKRLLDKVKSKFAAESNKRHRYVDDEEIDEQRLVNPAVGVADMSMNAI